jgi:hypothetical protein
MTSRSDDEPTGGTGKNVGYGNPPEHSRFKPGQSGNPKGRPKRKVTPLSLLEAALARQVTVRVGGVPKHMSALEASFLNLSNKAASGDLKALALIMSLRPALERQAASADEGTPRDRAEDEALIAEFLKRVGPGPSSEVTS